MTREAVMRAMAWWAGAGTRVAACGAAAAGLSPQDEAAAFTAAGFKKQGGKWRACDDPGTASYSPGSISEVVDLNGDGMPEAIIVEGSAYCYGMTGSAFAIVSKQAGGRWKMITGDVGIAEFLATKGADGWPDISVGGPGFCFPVQRWNGKQYVLNRHEYEGKRCKPNR
jgi:hypothetical protein